MDGQQLVKGRATKMVPLARSYPFDADLYTGHIRPLLDSEVSGLMYFMHFDASKAMLVITSAIPPSPMMAKDTLTTLSVDFVAFHGQGFAFSLHTGSSICSRSQLKLAGFQFPLALAQAVQSKYFALPRKTCPA